MVCDKAISIKDFRAAQFFFAVAILCAFIFPYGFAQQPQPTFQDELLDHHLGAWVLEGTIAHKQTTHDVTCDWVLNHQYLHIHEVSREKNTKGEPAYEAMVFVGWDAANNRYFAIWHDVWGGFNQSSIGYAPRNGDEIRFLFKDNAGKPDFHTTFAYDRSADTWDWLMDNDDNGALKPFARVKLTHTQSSAQGSTLSTEITMTHHATGTFDVKMIPQDDKSVEGVSRMLGEKQYHGDLDGAAKLQMLATGNPKTSAVYVAIEAFTGSLKGKSGTFALYHTGIMSKGAPNLSIDVVPDSGTGQLAGISGRMSINIAADGKHFYDLEYTLPAEQK